MPEILSSIATDPYRRSVLAVRTAGNPLAVVPALRDLVADLDPGLPIYDVRTMEQVRAASVASQRFLTALFGLFAVVALTLAVVGIYGVSVQAAKARTREVGIRMALGARTGDVQRLMVGRGSVLVAAGLGAGVIASLAATRLMSGLLFGVEATDPLTFSAVLVILGSTAGLANWIPARTASRTDPMQVLRED
jgi:ABC-type antimicrobial peptide transport system permease subunit